MDKKITTYVRQHLGLTYVRAVCTLREIPVYKVEVSFVAKANQTPRELVDTGITCIHQMSKSLKTPRTANPVHQMSKSLKTPRTANPEKIEKSKNLEKAIEKIYELRSKSEKKQKVSAQITKRYNLRKGKCPNQK